MNCEESSRIIRKKDEEALKSLIRLEFSKDPECPNFSLIFEFKDNDYFNYCLITKKFIMKDEDTAISSKSDNKIE